MTAKTHKVFAVSWVIIAAMFIYTYGVSQINYYMTLILMISMGKAGALFPDVDHHWQSVKEKTTVNWVINKIIHMTGGKHRSWQTHSWDIWIISTLFAMRLCRYCLSNGYINQVNYEVANIIILGFCSGWMSHLFSDMLTSAGVRIVCWSNKKAAFVPKELNVALIALVSFVMAGTGLFLACVLYYTAGYILVVVGALLLLAGLKLGKIRFNTGHEWEECVFRFMKICNTVVGIIAIIYPLLIAYYAGKT